MEKSIDTAALHKWFDENRRTFPWRENPTPYRVWISEVMLQQTRASVVIPYFERWMELFPDPQVLSRAPLEEVIKAWEGLGYYGRARHLHEGARQIDSQFSGKVPSRREHLEKIKGLGPYMVNAILSFAFHQRAAAVDGNVLRVLARHFLIEEDIGRSAAKKNIQVLADEMLDAKRPWVTAEALIELGATLCQSKPLCDVCPLQSSCLAFKEDRAEEFPVKSKEQPVTMLTRSVAVIEENNSILLRKGVLGKIMADLYEFPYFEGLDRPLPQHIGTLWGLSTSFVRSLPLVQHSFTRYQAQLFPIHLRALERKEIKDYEWIPLERVGELPFSAGHKRVLEHFLKRMDPQLTLF
ncbi:MAG: mutY [Parachlamydiales bacterium]|nr:mutY [Parachlamydiales bacterium]